MLDKCVRRVLGFAGRSFNGSGSWLLVVCPLLLAIAGMETEVCRADRLERTRVEVEALMDAKGSKPPDWWYDGNSTAFNGPMRVETKIAASRIVSVRVTKHREKQFYLSLEKTPAAIVEKQSLKGIDAVTGATITSQAILNATAQALAEALP